jgi:hypothetical protein
MGRQSDGINGIHILGAEGKCSMQGRVVHAGRAMLAMHDGYKPRSAATIFWAMG